MCNSSTPCVEPKMKKIRNFWATHCVALVMPCVTMLRPKLPIKCIYMAFQCSKIDPNLMTTSKDQELMH